MLAKEYFEGVRAEVLETNEALEMLERMEAREGAKTQRYCKGVGGGEAADPMDNVTARIDFEGKLRQRIADAEGVMDEACTVLYGADGRGGLAKLKGTRYADAICMYYCNAQTWAEIADIMQCTDKWCRKLCEVGFAYIDREGWVKVKTA